MNSRTGQVGRDSSFNSLLRVLSPVQSRSELMRPEAELVAYKIEVLFGLQSPESVGTDQTGSRTGSLQNRSLVWAPALISLSSSANPVADTLFTSSCVCWRQA